MGSRRTRSPRAHSGWTRTQGLDRREPICHKGLLLEREQAHLESMGVSKEMYGEILFLCG